jgi:hypothetical protein
MAARPGGPENASPAAAGRDAPAQALALRVASGGALTAFPASCRDGTSLDQAQDNNVSCAARALPVEVPTLSLL